MIVRKFLESKSLTTLSIYALSLTVLSLNSYSAFAAVTCPAGYISDEFSNSDYTSLAPVVSPPTPNSNQSIIGTKNESYLITSNTLTTSGSLTAGSSNTYQSTISGGIQMFEFFQDFATKTSTRTVSYTFKNKFDNQSQALNNVSLTLYDLDTNIAGTDRQGNLYFEFFDQATITGVTSSGTVISPVTESKGVGMSNSSPYRQTNTTSNTTCSGLDERCRVSVAFNQPVVSVDVIYGNNPTLNYSTNGQANDNPGDQLLNIKFDGYCYLPQPRLIYKKELADPRKADTDEFVVQIKDNANNSVVTNSITTTTEGSGNIVTNGTGTTGTFKVDPTKTYTLTEAIAGTTNIANYADSYSCKKSDGTTVTTLDPQNLKLAYGDNWTCTITNSLKPYTFSGIVFDDNGGINAKAAERQNISSTFINNGSYFNGIFDSATESGIYDNNLQIRLTNCNGSDIATTSPNPQTVSNVQATRGRYSFIVPASALTNTTKVCLIESEPSAWPYTIDTTTNNREVTLANNVYNYKTEGSSRNLDFGEVQADNAALVLIKSQYVHECSNSLNYQSVTNSTDPTLGFSVNPISNISPGNCIAYRIQAYNRGHIGLQQVRISDVLQTTPVTSRFQQPTPLFIPTSVASPTVAYGTNGTIQSNLFNLAATLATASQPTSAILYFNTKYGTTEAP